MTTINLDTFCPDDVTAWLWARHQDALADEARLKRHLPRGTLSRAQAAALAGAAARRAEAHLTIAEWRRMLRAAREES